MRAPVKTPVAYTSMRCRQRWIYRGHLANLPSARCGGARAAHWTAEPPVRVAKELRVWSRACPTH